MTPTEQAIIEAALRSLDDVQADVVADLAGLTTVPPGLPADIRIVLVVARHCEMTSAQILDVWRQLHSPKSSDLSHHVSVRARISTDSSIRRVEWVVELGDSRVGRSVDSVDRILREGAHIGAQLRSEKES